MMLKENVQRWNSGPVLGLRGLGSAGGFIANLAFKKKKLFFRGILLFQNCEEFYMKETMECAL